MTTERLTTLAAVKEWLDIPPTSDDSDALLLRLINAASQFVLNWLNRDSFQLRVYTQNFKGNGKRTALLANWPVVSVASVGIGGMSVPASTIGNVGLPGSGFVVSDPRGTHQYIDLYGYGFAFGAPSQVVYTSGFTTEETVTLPAAADSKVAYRPTNGGEWSRDRGVTLDGAPLLTVDDTTPASGQYHVDEWGNYTFNVDAAEKIAVFSYDYTPFDVSFAVTEMIGEWYKRKDRIGLLSKTLGGQETVTFSQRDMGEPIQATLQSYKNVVPV